jgi:uncharacterized protein YndB with AHSA1/START domain
MTMPERSVTHATFTIERTYAASPARVFAAWAEPEAKARWFADNEGWRTDEYDLDFRVGGTEVYRGAPENGPGIAYEARYRDIVPDERLVYAYDMYSGETRISVSLGTIELKPDGEGTLLTYTEQGAFLDGHDSPEQREQGSAGIFDELERYLERESEGS